MADRAVSSVSPRVSVVIPAYNAAKYIVRAVDSALAQTMPDLEIIIVDDASTDTTADLIGQRAARDSRIRTLKNSHNSGSSASRNRSIDEARGEWIALLDADDAWAPERLERMLAEVENIDVVSDDVCIIRRTPKNSGEFSNKSLIRQQGLKVGKPRRISLLEFVEHDLGLLKPILRRAFVYQNQLAYKPDILHAEDYVLYFEALASGARWRQLPQAYYFYRRHGASETMSGFRDQSKKLALWQSSLKNTQNLLMHPSAKADAAITAALNRHRREALGHIAFATLWEALRQKRFADVGRLVYKQPTNLVVVLRYVAKRSSERVVRRMGAVLSRLRG